MTKASDGDQIAAWRSGAESAAQVVESYLAAYPADVFKQPPAGQHGETVDACSAAALRAVLPSIAEDIRRLLPPDRELVGDVDLPVVDVAQLGY